VGMGRSEEERIERRYLEKSFAVEYMPPDLNPCVSTSFTGLGENLRSVRTKILSPVINRSPWDDPV
jgi:hypothetical protein